MKTRIAALAVLAGLMPVLAAANPVETILHRFASRPRYGQTGPQDGGNPLAGFIMDPNGVLYGTTSTGGGACGSNGSGCGAIYTLTPPATGRIAWTKKMLARFEDEGSYPSAALTFGPGGTLFGTTASGDTADSINGTVFELVPPVSPRTAWTKHILYRFTGASADGSHPVGRLLLGQDGALYGTTQAGGAANYGTIFKLAPPIPPKQAWKATILHSFTGADGASPLGGLTAISGGRLVGAASGGGADGFGVIYALTPPVPPHVRWAEATLFAFTGYSTGFAPQMVDLIADTNGTLYGTTASGGAGSAGTVFSLTPPAEPEKTWTQTILYSFAGGADGATPYAGLTGDASGNLYGTTRNGGPAGFGTVYKLSPPATTGGTWTETVLHSFAGGRDGSLPVAPVLVSGGNLYGSTNEGGATCPQWTADGCGTVFKIVP